MNISQETCLILELRHYPTRIGGAMGMTKVNGFPSPCSLYEEHERAAINLDSVTTFRTNLSCLATHVFVYREPS